jgi:hypothetical protein
MSMSEVIVLAILFLIVFAVLFVIALTFSPRLRAQIRLTFGIFFKIYAACPQLPRRNRCRRGVCSKHCWPPQISALGSRSGSAGVRIGGTI